MNKITDQTFALFRNGWQKLLRHIFDDAESIEGGHFKHSEYFCQMVAEVDLEWATEIVTRCGLSYACPDNREVDPASLVGSWMVDGTTSPDNGFYWDCVSEIVKVEKVTKTVTVTEWKPICNETVEPCCSQQPQSKVCLPTK